MIPNTKYFQALRDCCKDEAAFERLQALLAEMECSQTNTIELEQQLTERTQQLHQKCAELQETKRLKEVILHTVAHDLRTSVMGSLMVFKNLLGQAGHQLSIARTVAERLVEGGDRQLNLISSLLETHNTEQQGVVLQPESMSFNTLLQAVVQDWEPALQKNQVTLTNLIAADCPPVLADSTQMYRVLEGLLSVALKYNPPGLNLTFTAQVESSQVRFTIQDNGRGMSQIECNRLFDLRIHDPQSRCSTRLGIKLYLCRQIIKAHGGEIGVVSNPNQGTLVWFTLPLAQVGSPQLETFSVQQPDVKARNSEAKHSGTKVQKPKVNKFLSVEV